MKIKLLQGQKIWFTSDSHYSHKNIVKSLTVWGDDHGDAPLRDFDSIEDMNNHIVNSINNVVGENDILVHIGDWSFGGVGEIWNFRKRINCKTIHIFPGNHDQHIKNNRVLPNVHRSPDNDLGMLRFGSFIDDPNPNIYGDHRDTFFDVRAQDIFSSVNQIGNLTVVEWTPKNIKEVKYKFVCCHFPVASWESLGSGVMHLHGHLHSRPDERVGPGRMIDVGHEGQEDFEPNSLREILDNILDRPIKSLYRHEY